MFDGTYFVFIYSTEQIKIPAWHRGVRSKSIPTWKPNWRTEIYGDRRRTDFKRVFVWAILKARVFVRSTKVYCMFILVLSVKNLNFKCAENSDDDEPLDAGFKRKLSRLNTTKIHIKGAENARILHAFAPTRGKKFNTLRRCDSNLEFMFFD